MTSSPHKLFLASAGTGKTFQLTNHFLKLLFAGVPPERILATTFTRKAAGEILDRVLERLVAGARCGEAVDDLRVFVSNPELTQDDCLRLLGKLTRAIDRFQVRTIDAFFVQLARLFALDLELPPDWSIVDEREDLELRSEAVQSVLSEGSSAEKLELLRGLQGGAATSRVHEGVLQQLMQGRDVFLESDESAWQRVQPGTLLDEAALDVYLTRLREFEVPQTKAGKPDKRWEKAVNTVLVSTEGERWADLIDGGLGMRLLDCSCQYYGVEFSDELMENLSPIVEHAVASLVKELAGRNAALFELLRRFEESYQQLKRSRGAFRFEDLPLALAGGAARGRPIDERELGLWFRLDGRLDHLLLDEFQDTAPLQWRILAPLAEEVLADGTGDRSFFCVGDEKQSIYGWRKAEPRLLAGLAERYPVLEETRMAKSYRSSRVVLDTVNRVFEAIGENDIFREEGRDVQAEAASAWQARYPLHEAANDLPGAAYLTMAEEPDAERGESDVDMLLRRCVDRVVLIQGDAPEATVGILLRKRASIPQLIHALRERGIQASGEGGNPLTDAESVLAFLSLLHVADYPDDSAAAFHLASTPLGVAVGLEVTADVAARREWSRSVRARLAARGLGVFVEELEPGVANDAGWSAWDRQRFGQLVDLAHAFADRASLRPSDFAEHVRQEKVEAPGGARVRVMTIHASKGLEFDAVVLPELQVPLIGKRDRLLSTRSDPYAQIDMVSSAPTEALARGHAKLRELYDSATSSTVTESLCVLYVAMTRAARRIELIVPWLDVEKAAKKALPLKGSELLRVALLEDLAQEPAADGVLWAHPDCSVEWALGCASSADNDVPVACPPVFRLAPSTRPRSAPTRSPSSTEGGGMRRAGSLLAPMAGATVGTLVHRWLEECEWVEDFDPAEDSLRELAQEVTQDEALIGSALHILRAALESDPIRAALSLSACDVADGEQPSVRNEHAFSVLLPAGDGHEELWNGFIDRLVLVESKGRVVRAEVIDHKTDTVSSGAELEERVAYYRPQLENYRRIVCEQFQLESAAVTCRLLFLAAGEVVDL